MFLSLDLMGWGRKRNLRAGRYLHPLASTSQLDRSDTLYALFITRSKGTCPDRIHYPLDQTTGLERMPFSDPSKDCIRQDHLPSRFDNIDDRSDSVAAQRTEHELWDTTSSLILEDSCGGQRDAQRSVHWCENSRDERRKWTDGGSSKPKRSDWFSDMIDHDVHQKNRSMLPHPLRTSLPIDKRKNICLLHHRRDGQSNHGTLWLCLHPLPKHSCGSSKLISRSRSFLVAGWQRPTWTVAILHLQFWRLKTNPLLASDESLLD